MLNKFQCTADGFRKKFRDSKPKQDEPFQTYAIELQRLFERWVTLAGIEKTFEGLTNLIVSEQLLESVSKELATFLKENGKGTLDDLTTTAEAYRLAHPDKNMSKKGTASIFGSLADTEIQGLSLIHI